MPLKDEWRDEVLRLHESGLSRDGITAEVPISSAYVSQIVAEAGRTFPGTGQSARATQGRIAKRARARIAQAERLIPLAEQALAAGDAAGASPICVAIERLLGLSPVDVLLHDAEWIARAIGQPPD